MASMWLCCWLPGLDLTALALARSPGASTHLPPSSLPASENDLLNKRLKLDYEEITPCLKEVTTVWEKMLSTPGRSKIKFDMERMHTAVGQGECDLL